MFKYKIYFSKYELRCYEKDLALKEFKMQFPEIRDKLITETGISFTTNKLLNERKLQKLTFYSEYHYENSRFKKRNILTDQALVESCRKDKNKNLCKNIKPNKTREIRYLTHSIHEYKGRFYPQLAKVLMNYACIKKGDTVLDPFCGSGTTLVESFLFGANAIGIDINPIAFLLAKTKVRCLLLKQEDLIKIRKSFEHLNEDCGWKEIKFEEYSNSLDIGYLKNWFPRDNLKKIMGLS